MSTRGYLLKPIIQDDEPITRFEGVYNHHDSYLDGLGIWIHKEGFDAVKESKITEDKEKIENLSINDILQYFWDIEYAYFKDPRNGEIYVMSPIMIISGDTVLGDGIRGYIYHWDMWTRQNTIKRPQRAKDEYIFLKQKTSSLYTNDNKETLIDLSSITVIPIDMLQYNELPDNYIMTFDDIVPSKNEVKLFAVSHHDLHTTYVYAVRRLDEALEKGLLDDRVQITYVRPTVAQRYIDKDIPYASAVLQLFNGLKITEDTINSAYSLYRKTSIDEQKLWQNIFHMPMAMKPVISYAFPWVIKNNPVLAVAMLEELADTWKTRKEFGLLKELIEEVYPVKVTEQEKRQAKNILFGRGRDNLKLILQNIEAEQGNVEAASKEVWNAKIYQLFTGEEEGMLAYNSIVDGIRTDYVIVDFNHEGARFIYYDNIDTMLSVIDDITSGNYNTYEKEASMIEQYTWQEIQADVMDFHNEILEKIAPTQDANNKKAHIKNGDNKKSHRRTLR